MIEVTTIDNMYEDDGMANLYASLHSFILAAPLGQKEKRLQCVTFEYRSIDDTADPAKQQLWKAHIVCENGK